MSEFTRTYPPAQPTTGSAYWLPLRGEHEFMIAAPPQGLGSLLQGEPAQLLPVLNPLTDPLYLGTLDGLPVMTCQVKADLELSSDWQSLGLRALYGRLDETGYTLAGYAYQMLCWQRTSRFCPACGSPTVPLAGDWGMRCTGPDGLVRYPPVSPAVLMLIHDGGDRILLSHKKGWGKMYSILAGFVEPGETLEDCVRRETYEEVGLRLAAEPVYNGSQPWPFPHQIMIGYMAQSAGGPIRVDELELDEARWFEMGDLPPIPPPLSLSRQLIDRWVASRQAISDSQ